MATIKWHGAAVRARVAAAAATAIDHTMDRCVEESRADHGEYPPASAPYTRFANRSGNAVEEIDIFAHATFTGLHVKGYWGGASRHSLFLEIGTSVAGPTAEERAEEAGGNMNAVPPPIGPLMAPRPVLRPAADREYPLLGIRIGQAFRGERLA
jgi:hypothetical protein